MSPGPSAEIDALVQRLAEVEAERDRIQTGICWRGECRQSATMIAPGGWPLCTEHGAERMERLAEAVKDVLWRAVQYGQTDDGDTFAYIVTKGAMHRLLAAAQSAGISAAFRADSTKTLPDTTPLPSVRGDQ